uniref:Uncharacterized protein n=1 Tax=Rhizophora mucronata TaxID=61149 RepID=A0A2P2NAK6_RHIMU
MLRYRTQVPENGSQQILPESIEKECSILCHVCNLGYHLLEPSNFTHSLKATNLCLPPITFFYMCKQLS